MEFNPVGNRVCTDYSFHAVESFIRGVQIIWGIQLLQVMNLTSLERIGEILGQLRMALQKLALDLHNIAYGTDPCFKRKKSRATTRPLEMRG